MPDTATNGFTGEDIIDPRKEHAKQAWREWSPQRRSLVLGVAMMYLEELGPG